MTATEKLRELLDERGIPWYAKCSDAMTEWQYNGITYRAYKERRKLQVAYMTPLTPEQAIAATVGETCHRVKGKLEDFDYCSECGGMLARWIEADGKVPCYCPSCGAKVVIE